MEYVYRLKENDSITLINDNNGCIEIKCEKGNLLVEELDKDDKEENTIFSRLDINIFKHYAIIDTFYTRLVTLTENSPKLRKELNHYVDEIVRKLFGEEYVKKDINITGNEYYCLSTYDRN